MVAADKGKKRKRSEASSSDSATLESSESSKKDKEAEQKEMKKRKLAEMHKKDLELLKENLAKEALEKAKENEQEKQEIPSHEDTIFEENIPNKKRTTETHGKKTPTATLVKVTADDALRMLQKLLRRHPLIP